MLSVGKAVKKKVFVVFEERNNILAADEGWRSREVGTV